MRALDNTKYEPRPYLVVPKLIKQPTWGGNYIVEMKQWADRDELGSTKIGQSYELFSGSNLSMLDSSENPAFCGELKNNIDVETPTRLPDTVALADLVAESPVSVLGEAVVRERGEKLELLIKFTQALGNSYQTHIKTGLQHPKWKPKPESWYYFEPGLITLGIKSTADWAAYEGAVRGLEHEMQQLANLVANGEMTYENVQLSVRDVLTRYDPRQYVNLVPVARDELVDLSAGGIHHSWEEDAATAPLGNILLELQGEAMDAVSTFRSFDKGKLGRDGTLRPLHIDDYFDAIDRSPEANDPAKHLRKPRLGHQTGDYGYEHLLESLYYNLDKLSFTQAGASYEEKLARYKHLFVKTGRVSVEANGYQVLVSAGHSCFLPANVGTACIRALTDDDEVLISY